MFVLFAYLDSIKTMMESKEFYLLVATAGSLLHDYNNKIAISFLAQRDKDSDFQFMSRVPHAVLWLHTNI